ncbi:putative echinoderm microtubule associated protein like 1, partial [Operophtera brumata]
MRMYLRGRPVVLHGPSELDTLDPAKVAPPPSNKLKLEWIVYFVAGVVVLFNVEEQCQRHYTGHTDDVKCLAVHPNKLVLASGQCAGHDRHDARVITSSDCGVTAALHGTHGRRQVSRCAPQQAGNSQRAVRGARLTRPSITVWNSVSLATLAVLGAGQIDRAVACLSFSRADGGALLACVDDGADHTISVWEWQRPDKGHLDTVVSVEFHPLDRNQIVTCGKNHIAFWTLDQSNVLYKRMGIFESRDKPKYVTCLAFNHNGDVLSGDSNGNIIAWGRGTNTVLKLVRGVHQGAVFGLLCLKEGAILSAGGKDGRLVMFDAELNAQGLENTGAVLGLLCLKEGAILSAGGKDGRLVMFDAELNAQGLENTIEGHYGGVRVVAEGRGSQLFIGTTKNCILHGDLELGFSPAVLGASAVLRVVARWRRDRCGHALRQVDGNATTCRQVTTATAMRDVPWATNTCPISFTTIGVWPENADGTDINSCVRYVERDDVPPGDDSDDDARRAVGHQHVPHLLHHHRGVARERGRHRHQLVCEVTTATTMRDVPWATNTCPISFTTIGVWPENADGTDINSCVRSHDSRLAATGDDFGKVKLFAYPVQQP